MNINVRRFCLLCLAGGWLITAIATAGEPSVADLVGSLKNADDAVRENAAEQLGGLGDKAASAVAPLTEALQDKSVNVRAHAAWALGQIGAPAQPAASALVALLKDPDAKVRGQAITALGKIRSASNITLPELVKLLEDADPAIRLRVLNTIAETGEAAVPALIQALKNDKAAYWACLVLRDMGPAAQSAVPALTEKLAAAQPEVRREAVLALAAIGSGAASAATKITALLDDEQLKAPATYALIRVGRIPADAEAKIQANAKSTDKYISTTSLWALAMIHPSDKKIRQEATESLIEGLKSQDPLTRVASARALAALPPAPDITIPIFEKAFKDADEATVRHALDALSGLGPAAVPRLIEALKHTGVRIEVATMLGRMGATAAPATETLAALILDKDPSDDKYVLLALAKIGPGAKAAVPALVEVLKKGDSPEIHGVIYALGSIGPDAASAAALIEANLKSKDVSLALISAWALAKIQPASSEIAAKTVPVLIAGLTSPISQYRQGAAEALGELGSLASDAVPALQKALSDEEPAVRRAAAQAIRLINGTTGVRRGGLLRKFKKN